MARVRILSVDGGGYLGLATAALIAELERHFDCRFTDRFDLFAGTSTGALIALGLAAGKSGSDLQNIYEQHGRTLFPAHNKPQRALRKIRQFFGAKYSNKALRRVLEETFGSTTLGEVQSSGKKLLVPAFCLTTGSPRIFKTDHAAELTAHSGYRLADIALATSAAPTFFPIIGLKAPTNGTLEMFCDGGVFANDPALLAYAEAVSHLEAAPADVEILSISTPRIPLASKKHRSNWSRGAMSWAFSLPEVFVQGTADTSAFALKRIAGASGSVYERIGLPNRHLLPIDLASGGATNSLKAIGLEIAQAQETRDQVERFLDGKKG